MKVIILAGGGGTRLWPLSKDKFPKQFINFGSERSLLQKTVARFIAAPIVDEVLIATNEQHLALVQDQLAEIQARCSILIEPMRRNTAPAIALAVKALNTKDPILVVPSDHLVEPEEILLNALEQINPDDKIVTFGIRPTRPETGYGYIEICEKNDSLTFKAKRFTEKPGLEIAKKYIENPHFYWNSGMFLFQAQTFWRELKKHAPLIWTLCQDEEICFSKMPDISIDYAILEKSKDVVVCPLAISWSDVGCWDSVYETMEKDADQNVKIGRVLSIDTKNSLIFSGKRLISTIGLEDLLIVETDEAILISKKGESQKIKMLLQEIKKQAVHENS